MSDDKGADENNPLEQLVELFVYAPIGLLYEYDDVVPKLVKRGKSQVQLARVLGQMAMRQGQSQSQGQKAADDFANAAGDIVGRALNDLGAMFGLIPDDAAAEPDVATDDPVSDDPPAIEGPRPLPIANYDDLKAREIIPLLVSLSPAQRDAIRAHEEANRGRKTVLAKLDQLAQ